MLDSRHERHHANHPYSRRNRRHPFGYPRRSIGIPVPHAVLRHGSAPPGSARRHCLPQQPHPQAPAAAYSSNQLTSFFLPLRGSTRRIIYLDTYRHSPNCPYAPFQPYMSMNLPTHRGREMVDKNQTETPDGESCHRLQYKDLVDRMISQIKAGAAPWQKPWKPARLPLPITLALPVSRRNCGAAGGRQQECHPHDKLGERPSPHTRG